MGRNTAVQAFRAIASATFAVVVAVAAVSCAPPTDRSVAAHYCAIMSDSIGLYVGNPVTQMGYKIGEVKSIVGQPDSVRVNFTVTEDRPLPHDVKAVTRSPSVLADRALELVGNYESGPQLAGNECIALKNSATPKGLSEIIESATTLIDSINPEGSTNILGTVQGLNELAQGNGARANQLITTTSALLGSPDQAISDMGSIVANLADLTTTLAEIRGPMKQVLLDARTTTGDVVSASESSVATVGNISPLVTAVSDLESEVGDETQLTLDSVGVAMRKMSPHANAMANLLNPVPWWINTAANHFNNRDFHTFNIAYRPPMFRVPTHDGLLMCGFMNDRVPGSCADVHGQPYAVDVALLQYVLMEASR